MLSLFFLSILGATLRDQHHYTDIIRAIISSAVRIKPLHFSHFNSNAMCDAIHLLFILQSIIAGSVAIAAQNLHLPTVRKKLTFNFHAPFTYYILQLYTIYSYSI